MRILVPIISFGREGGYRVLSEFANHWINEGHEVDFLVNQASDVPYYPTRARIKWVTNAGRILNVPEKKPNPWRYFTGLARRLLSLWIGISKIGKNYDVIMANHSLTAWPVSLASCGTAKKVYYVQAYEPECMEFGHDRLKVKTRVAVWLSRKSYDLNLLQISNSPVYIGYENVRAQEWVPPGVDFGIFYQKSRCKDLKTAKEIVIGCIGRKEPFKGMQYVLRAYEILWEQDHRYKLNVAFNNLPDGWTHPGLSITVPQNDKELGKYYRSLDIMIAHGMLQLGAPYFPVMEAMACGVPVVNTRHVPADEQNSWIINSGDVGAIVSAVKAVTADALYRDKVTKASKDIAEFEWNRVANRMLNIFSR